MATFGGPRFPGIENGLVFAVDPLNQESWLGPDSNIVNNIPPLSSTISGSIQNDTSGSYGSNESFSFDGTDDYINCGNNSSLQIFQNSHTQSFWIKYTGTVQGYIGGYGVDSVVIFHGSNRIRFYTKGLTSGTDFYSTSTLSDNEWYHIACTYELNGDKKIYINGVLDNTVSTSGTITSEGVAYTIGARNLSSSIDNYFNGQIGPILIYNRTLSAGEVSQNYNQLKSRFT